MSAQYPDVYGPYTAPNRADNAVAPGRFAAHLFRRIGVFDFTIGTEATNVIAITIQARDAKGRKWNDRLIIDVMFSTTSFGACDATFDDVAITTGTFVTEWANDSILRVQSNTEGAVVLAVTKVGAYSVYVRASCGDRMTQYSSGTPLAATAVTWT